jgi:hypothetical protein
MVLELNWLSGLGSVVNEDIRNTAVAIFRVNKSGSYQVALTQNWQ